MMKLSVVVPCFNEEGTGYKLFSQKAVQGISIDSESFDVEAEIVGKILKQGLRVVEVPIQYEYRKKGKAKITWKHGVTSLWRLLEVKCRN